MSNRAKLRQKELKKQQERAAENRAANPEKYSTNNVIKGRKTGKERREDQQKKREENRKRRTDPCDIEKITITSAKNPKESVNLTGGLVRFMYYESLLSNTIKATYTYSDTGNTVNNAKTGSNCKNTGTALEKLPIVGGEIASIKIVDNRGAVLEFSPEKNNPLIVNKPTPFDDKTTKSAVQLQLISKEYLENEKLDNRVVKCYEGKISEHIEKLVKENLNTDKSVDLEETGAKNYNFIGNTRKPFYCINNLSTRAVPQGNEKSGNSAGFLFWETADGYNFKSLDTLLGQNMKKSIAYNETPDNGNLPAGYDLKALEYSRSSENNVQGKMMMGAYSTQLRSFDLYNPDFNEEELSSEKGGESKGSQDSLTLAGEELPLYNKDYYVPSRISWSVLDTGSQSGGTTEEQLDKSKEENFDLKNVYNQSIMRYNQLFSATVTVTVGGDFSLHAGDAIFIDGPSLKAETTSNDDIDKKDGGVYIIADLAHYISPKETYTKMNLIRDSSGRKGNHSNRNAAMATQDNFLSNIK
tara:strand:+ start:465 stop:2045 length:1581 start_codon:yes stop_codon:yes gene_type:complete